jgi:hypothetical protein
MTQGTKTGQKPHTYLFSKKNIIINTYLYEFHCHTDSVWAFKQCIVWKTENKKKEFACSAVGEDGAIMDKGRTLWTFKTLINLKKKILK